MEKTKEKLKSIKRTIDDNNIKLEFYEKNINDFKEEIK